MQRTIWATMNDVTDKRPGAIGPHQLPSFTDRNMKPGMFSRFCQVLATHNQGSPGESRSRRSKPQSMMETAAIFAVQRCLGRVFIDVGNGLAHIFNQ